MHPPSVTERWRDAQVVVVRRPYEDSEFSKTVPLLAAGSSAKEQTVSRPFKWGVVRLNLAGHTAAIQTEMSLHNRQKQ